MYGELLRGLFAVGNLMTAERQETYLRELQPQVRALRQAYPRYPVVFDSADRSVQAAYLLAYLPHYTELLYEVFVRIADITTPARLSLFGSGPCPEVVGLLRYIQDCHPQHADALQVTTYDIAHDDWAWSRNKVVNRASARSLKIWLSETLPSQLLLAIGTPPSWATMSSNTACFKSGR